MTDIKQARPFLEYLQCMGWRVVDLGGDKMVVKKMPLVGSVAKLQHPHRLPESSGLIETLLKEKIKVLSMEPYEYEEEYDKKCKIMCRDLKKYKVKIVMTPPFLHTKTRLFNLDKSEKELFGEVAKSRRKCIRRAYEFGVVVKESQDFAEFKQLSLVSDGFKYMFRVAKVKQLAELMGRENYKYYVVYSKQGEFLGADMILYWGNVAYIWIGGNSALGFKLYAPSMCNWHTIIEAKKMGYGRCDFVGEWDERFPKKNLVFQGFSNYKKSFGGEAKYYPIFGTDLMDENKYIRLINS